jgi:alanine racemase
MDNGVDMLGVAFPEEGIELRESNINIPILVLNPVLSEQTEDVLKYSMGATVCNLDYSKRIS